MPKRKHPLLQAVDVTPTKVALAGYLGMRPQSLNGLLRLAESDIAWPVPAHHTLAIAALLTGRPHDVRPDLYPVASWKVSRVKIDSKGRVLR
jgi:hypothetical protein